MAYLQQPQSCRPGNACWRAAAETLAPKGSWQSTVLSCCSDAATCCYGCWLLPCLYGSVASRMRGGGCGGHCAAYCLLSFLCLCACAAKDTRQTLRERFNLEPQPCNDCIVHTCCAPCAVCQEARELKKRKVFTYQPPPAQFATTSAPPQQQMGKL